MATQAHSYEPRRDPDTEDFWVELSADFIAAMVAMSPPVNPTGKQGPKQRQERRDA